jgi:hypothetical protein
VHSIDTPSSFVLTLCAEFAKKLIPEKVASIAAEEQKVLRGCGVFVACEGVTNVVGVGALGQHAGGQGVMYSKYIC